MNTSDDDISQRRPDEQVHGNFGVFLAVLTIAFVVSGFAETWATALGLALSSLLAVVAFRNARVITDGRWATTLCALSIGSTVTLLVIDDASEWRAVPMIVQACILAVLVALTVMAALRRSRVDLQTLLAAICAYVLIGFVYAWTYLAIDVVDDTQLSMSASDPTTYFSFSFVVQTTLGFGDQTPTGPFAARLVVTQAVIGQIFLATLIARLVSLYGRPNARAGSSNPQ